MEESTQLCFFSFFVLASFVSLGGGRGGVIDEQVVFDEQGVLNEQGVFLYPSVGEAGRSLAASVLHLSPHRR